MTRNRYTNRFLSNMKITCTIMKQRYVYAILDSFHAILKTIPNAFCSDVLSVIFSTMDCFLCGDAGHQEQVPCDHIVLLSIHGHYRRGEGGLSIYNREKKSYQ